MKAPKMRFGFITDGEPFHGASPEERALGGSETALVQMARALVARGHEVQVFCRCPAPGDYLGVLYRDRGDLVRAAGEERWDVLVVSRFFTALDLPLQAGLKVLWNHDILDKPQALAQRLDSLDLALVLSRFHGWDYARRLPEIAPKLAVTRNGLDLGLLDQASRGVRPVPGRAVYVSRPERGLKLLLEQIWPRLLERAPGAALTVCGYNVSHTDIHPALQEEYARIDSLLASTPGVEVMGALAKQDYYRHLASCQVMLYPCVFPEISCIAALEAQALGLPVLTSDAFALSETVLSSEFRVPGQPGSPEYVEAYAAGAAELFAQPDRARETARAARDQVREQCDWAVIAAEWEEMFLARLEERVRVQAEPLAASLILTGDRGAAAELLGRELAPPESGPAPEDPDEEGLLRELAMVLERAAAQSAGGGVGVFSADDGRTASALGDLLTRQTVRELSDWDQPRPELAAVLIRDRLEREEDPAELIRRALAWCAPDAHLALCTASGAWPLLGPGYLGRVHDLGREDIISLLPGRALAMIYLPRGLVGGGAHRWFAGRWLALAPALGPEPGGLDAGAKLRRARPAPPEVIREVRRAGLL